MLAPNFVQNIFLNKHYDEAILMDKNRVSNQVNRLLDSDISLLWSDMDGYWKLPLNKQEFIYNSHHQLALEEQKQIPITNNKSLNYENMTKQELLIIEDACIVDSKWIQFEGAKIKKGVLYLYGCDQEDIIPTPIKFTFHNLTDGDFKRQHIQSIKTSGKILRNRGFDTDFVDVPEMVDIYWW